MSGNSIVHGTALVGAGCTFGHFCVIGEGVELGAGVEVGHHVVIHPGTKIGPGCRIGDHAVLGKQPSVAKTSTLKITALSPLVIGRDSTVGTASVLYAGTTLAAECFVADNAQVRERCTLGRRVIIGCGSTVENDTSIGEFTKLQTGVYLTAWSVVEENCFLAPAVVTSNDNYLGRTEARHAQIGGPRICKGARIGAGAVLLPGIHVGQEALVAAGAVVTRNVEPYGVVMGVPARRVRGVSPAQLLYPQEES